ncbi:hypothetical protein V2J09_008941 [Rumex salicifolius]
MGRSSCCTNDIRIKKGPWSPDEDHKLVSYIQKHGYSNWRTLPSLAGLNRCGKSCRLRWINYLRPDINRGKFTPQEEQTILNLHAIWGNRWSAIASVLPGRTDNEVKNFWNTHLKKKLIRMGLDPVTHLPSTDALSTQLPNLIAQLASLTEVLVAAKAESNNNNNVVDIKTAVFPSDQSAPPNLTPTGQQLPEPDDYYYYCYNINPRYPDLLPDLSSQSPSTSSPCFPAFPPPPPAASIMFRHDLMNHEEAAVAQYEGASTSTASVSELHH